MTSAAGSSASAHEVDVDADDEALSALLDAAARQALAAAGLAPSELSVVLTDDEGIRELNARWRAKDVATDVLSFPQQEPPVRGGVLGDVVISLPTAQAQAQAVGHAVEQELRVLLVHGLCHLLGEDHETDAQAAAMQAREATLLQALGGGAAGLVERAGEGR